ncbi:MAG: NRDE family protein [Gammaproteobacteria bacterium]
MCLLVFALDAHPRYRLVFAGNRDEYHSRPTDPAGWWRDQPDVLGGRDLEAGGTWLAVSRGGRFGVVTNYRELTDAGPAARSRGALVADFAGSRATPAEFGAALAVNAHLYAGYSLILGDRDGLHYFSNRAPSLSPLDRGVHGLSNERLNTPWPKLERTRRRFEDLLASGEPEPDTLLGMLADRQPAADGDRPDTGLDPALERLLSAPFVVSPSYGTRSSTVVLVDRADSVRFKERRFGPDGESIGASEFEFRSGVPQ